MPSNSASVIPSFGISIFPTGWSGSDAFSAGGATGVGSAVVLTATVSGVVVGVVASGIVVVATVAGVVTAVTAVARGIGSSIVVVAGAAVPPPPPPQDAATNAAVTRASAVRLTGPVSQVRWCGAGRR